ncbi:MAG: MFS transporter [Ruthenibacterium lactatiformans]
MFATYIFWGSICYTAINIPYGSMASVLSADAGERASLSTSRVGAMLANLIIAAATPLFCSAPRRTARRPLSRSASR